MTNRFCDDNTLTPVEKWSKIYGTTAIGNLPQYKVNNHVGKSYAPCPYDTEATDLRTAHLLGISVSGIMPTKVQHLGSDGKHYYMRINGASGAWLYECTFSGCPYLLSNGSHFFYR